MRLMELLRRRLADSTEPDQTDADEFKGSAAELPPRLFSPHPPLPSWPGY